MTAHDVSRIAFHLDRIAGNWPAAAVSGAMVILNTIMYSCPNLKAKEKKAAGRARESHHPRASMARGARPPSEYNTFTATELPRMLAEEERSSQTSTLSASQRAMKRVGEAWIARKEEEEAEEAEEEEQAADENRAADPAAPRRPRGAARQRRVEHEEDVEEMEEAQVRCDRGHVMVKQRARRRWFGAGGLRCDGVGCDAVLVAQAESWSCAECGDFDLCSLQAALVRSLQTASSSASTSGGASDGAAWTPTAARRGMHATRRWWRGSGRVRSARSSACGCRRA